MTQSKDLSSLKELVKEWTKKAQSKSVSDEERFTLYDCAEKLHDKIYELEKEQN